MSSEPHCHIPDCHEPVGLDEEAIQAITGNLFRGIDPSEHTLDEEIVKQNVATALRNMMQNANAETDASLPEEASPHADASPQAGTSLQAGVSLHEIAPGPPVANNREEEQENTAAALTGDWSIDQFNRAARPPKKSYSWCKVCNKWQSNLFQHKKVHESSDPVLCPEPLLGGVPGELCLEKYPDQASLGCHIVRDHGRNVQFAYKGGIRVNSSQGQSQLRGSAPEDEED